MNENKSVTKFLRYIGENPDLKPVKVFQAQGGEGRYPVRFGAPMPKGDVFIFPEYIAFLTVRRFSGGLLGLGEESSDYIKELFKVHRWAVHPASILIDVGKALAGRFEGKQMLPEALANQYSFFLPMVDITSIISGGGYAKGIADKSWSEAMRMPYITFTTDERSYVVYELVGLSIWNYNNLKRVKNMVTSKWHDDVIEYVAQRIANK